MYYRGVNLHILLFYLFLVLSVGFEDFRKVSVVVVYLFVFDELCFVRDGC